MSSELKLEQKRSVNIPALDVLMCFSDALDLISPLVSGHQVRVAYIALKLAEQYKLPKEQRDRLVMAACIHDIGATTVKERNDIIDPNFETDGRHETVGFYYTKESSIFKDIAYIIKYHHRKWEYGEGQVVNGEQVLLESHILHLADRIDTFIDKKSYVLHQVDHITQGIVERSESWFMPELVEAFKELAKNESFWLYTVSDNVENILYTEADLPKMNLDINELYDVAKWFSNIIDFRSRFTSVHSRGVATSAAAIATVMGFDEEDVKILKMSGFFHDLGKMAVSNNILEKNGKLDKEEFEVIRCHTFHTYNVLSRIKDIEFINKYAAYHHERLDGNGYPFHINADGMTLGSRILAVADIFTAIAEDRPYRIGMPKEKVIEIIGSLGDDKCLDSNVVKIFIGNYDEINEKRIKAQDLAREEYEKFWAQMNIKRS